MLNESDVSFAVQYIEQYIEHIWYMGEGSKCLQDIVVSWFSASHRDLLMIYTVGG